MPTQLDRIRYITEHYAQLQGFRLLPLSIPFVVAVWWDLFPAVSPVVVPPRLVEAALVALGVVASVPIRSYYERQFGTVPALPWRNGVLPLLAYSGLLVFAEVVRERLSWSFPLPMFVLALCLARLGLRAGRLRSHYLWVAAACLAFLALGRWHVPPRIRATEFDLLVVGGVVTAAIGDDRVLRRALTGTYAR